MNAFDELRLKLNPVKISNALQVLDGVMLSDGGIARVGSEAHLCVKQSDKLGTVDHSDWIEEITSNLEILGIQPGNGYPRSFSITSHGKLLTGTVLYTEMTNKLLMHYKRWYSKGSKQVPPDLRLTSVSLAHWFMGDGSSHNESRINHGAGSVDVKFATYCFNEESIDTLRHSLQTLSLPTNLVKVHQNGKIYMRVCLQRCDTGYFMNLIRDYIVPSYMYKVKVPAW